MIKIDKHRYFILYACCIPVKGHKRSVIYDLQRNTFIYIPNTVLELLQHNTIDIHDERYHDEKDDIIQIIDYLIAQEMGFITPEPNKFPKINMKDDDYPEIIKNIIIDFDKKSNHDLENIINQVSEIWCSTVELRYFDNVRESTFVQHLSCFLKSTIRTIHVVIRYAPWITEKKLNDICCKFKRLKQIIIYDSPMHLHTNNFGLETTSVFVKEYIENETCCGNIHPHYFRSNLDFFKESLIFNNCLYKKISIDRNGMIKNCPAMKKTFGHIDSIKLLDVISNNDFQKLWHIKKNDIDVCKDCEFRYMCLDCRALISDPDNIYSKPKKCNYDPYQTQWI